MSSQFLRLRFRWIVILAAAAALNFARPAFSAEPIIATISVQPSSVRLGSSFTATFSGTGITDQTYFDVRVVSPAGDDQVALNWQRGATGIHGVPVETTPGTWKIIGVRAHEDPNDHSPPLTAVSASLVVSPLVVT